MKVKRAMYCQYLLSSQTKYNQSHLAFHVAGWNPDDVYRYLKYETLTPSLVWERVKPIMTQSGNAYIIFDDTVLDKSYSFAIDGVTSSVVGERQDGHQGYWRRCQLSVL